MGWKKVVVGPGYEYGNIQILGPTDKRKNGYIVWRCRCSCGNELLLDTRTIQRETVKDCGCITKVKPGMVDLTGMRFGRLVVLGLTDKKSKNGSMLWKCQCDCGNICYSTIGLLKSGYKKSCGCLSHPKIRNIVGQRFGKLVVLEYAGKENGKHRWLCRCDCGNTTVVAQNYLESGHTRSCGCLQKSIDKDKLGFIDGTSITLIKYYKNNLSSNNKSGFNGVYKNNKEKWVAQIGYQNKSRYIGSYDTIEEAVEARHIAEKIYVDAIRKYYAGNRN